MSRFDLLLIVKDTEGKDTGERTVVEVKHWTGFSDLGAVEKVNRLLKLQDQLRKYKESGHEVLLEWKGLIPEEVQNLCDDNDINIKTI